MGLLNTLKDAFRSHPTVATVVTAGALGVASAGSELSGLTNLTGLGERPTPIVSPEVRFTPLVDGHSIHLGSRRLGPNGRGAEQLGPNLTFTVIEEKGTLEAIQIFSGANFERVELTVFDGSGRTLGTFPREGALDGSDPNPFDAGSFLHLTADQFHKAKDIKLDPRTTYSIRVVPEGGGAAQNVILKQEELENGPSSRDVRRFHLNTLQTSPTPGASLISGPPVEVQCFLGNGGLWTDVLLLSGDHDVRSGTLMVTADPADQGTRVLGEQQFSFELVDDEGKTSRAPALQISIRDVAGQNVREHMEPELHLILEGPDGASHFLLPPFGTPTLTAQPK